MKEARELLLDVSGITSREQLHALLAQTFDFPDYYGNNWDAFDECIRDFPPQGPVRVIGVHKLGKALPREAELLKQCFERSELTCRIDG